MKYLVIDACLGGTGIRDRYEGGYITPEKLGLHPSTIHRLNTWLSEYENEHYNGFSDYKIIDKLDREGKEIALMLKNELLDVKLEYFSDARTTLEMI